MSVGSRWPDLIGNNLRSAMAWGSSCNRTDLRRRSGWRWGWRPAAGRGSTHLSRATTSSEVGRPNRAPQLRRVFLRQGSRKDA
jgi:hypothetical protein